MDVFSSNSSMKVLSSDKVLQRELSILTKSMPSCMVLQISDCLRLSGTLTDYEVQLVHAEATDMQQAARLMQTLLHKGRVACLRFFQCLNACSPSLFSTVTRGSVKLTDEAHHHVEKSSCSEATATIPPCVIHINSSSLNNCIIGNNNSLCYLLSQTDVYNDLVEHTQSNPQQRKTPESTEAHVQVDRSSVEYVIIGDNNFMNVERSLDSQQEEHEEPTVCQRIPRSREDEIIKTETTD